MPTARAPPTNDNDGENLNGKIDNHTHASPASFMANESAGRFTTSTPIAIANSFGDRFSMSIQGRQN
jgi:hypothetical protein